MLDTAFVVWGVTVTWLEAVAFVLALACVVCNVHEIHWGWPLAIVSCALYAWLFHANRLYGDAGLQVYFAVASLWGWWQWLFGRRAPPAGGGATQPLRIASLGSRARLQVVGVWLAGWGVLGFLLATVTDSDVPWFDAFPTAGSVIGQVLLGRKIVENWWVWLGVNVVSIALLGYKGLWLTALLYLIFVGLAVQGLLRWRRILALQSLRDGAAAAGRA